MLFIEDIDGWDSWSRIFQRIDCFKDLIKFIFNKDNLPFGEIKNLHPGSNASFRVNGFVIKIFAPKESGFETINDYKQELFGINYANKMGIKSYKLISNGEINDKYIFRYLIYEYLDGQMVCDVNITDKKAFVKSLNNILDRLNQKIDFIYEYDPIIKSKENVRWRNLPLKLQEEVYQQLDLVVPSDFVYCHNDITRDNTLWKDDGLYLIDFADGNIAPRVCEYTTIIFDLFDFDLEYINEFKKTHCLDNIFDGILMHEYGYAFMTWISEKILHKDINDVTLLEIKDALLKYLS